MIFCSSCLPAAADAQFVECTSEQSHFIDGQPVFGLGLHRVLLKYVWERKWDYFWICRIKLKTPVF